MKPPLIWRIVSIAISFLLTSVLYSILTYTSIPFKGLVWILYLVLLVVILLGPWAYYGSRKQRM